MDVDSLNAYYATVSRLRKTGGDTSIQGIMGELGPEYAGREVDVLDALETLVGMGRLRIQPTDTEPLKTHLYEPVD